MNIFESLQRTQAIINQAQLSPAAMALAAMPSSVMQQHFEQISGLSEALTYATKTAFQQTQKITQVFRSQKYECNWNKSIS